MFISGPDVIKATTHEDVTMNELGGHRRISRPTFSEMARSRANC
jgi:acetyl-CoA carboxylase carboxyltransferase component